MTAKEFKEKLKAAGFKQEYFTEGVWTIETKDRQVKAVIKIRNGSFDITYRVVQPFSGHLISRYGVSLENPFEAISSLINQSVNFDNGTS